MYILVDDENRENEGDIVFCAADVDQKKLILWQDMLEVLFV